MDTIMPSLPEFDNCLRDHRVRLGWSQEDLAGRSGLSRAGVSAIETGRLIPSVAAALSLAAALNCRVEDLFRPRQSGAGASDWAWPPRREPGRYWAAEVEGIVRRYPSESLPLGVISHDGIAGKDSLDVEEQLDPARTLVMACCDPAIGLLAEEMARTAGLRLLAFQRSSRAALTLLGDGLIHCAGVHLSRSDDPEGNAGIIRRELGAGYNLLRVAHWEEGIALAPGLKVKSVGAALRSKLRWIGREDGSGARRCLDEILDGRKGPEHLAADHRGVAEAIRSGWAEAGVCLRLVGEEAGLDFLGVRQEAFDLCYPTRWEDDPRLKALVRSVRSPTYRRALGGLPGYDSTVTGVLHRVSG
jgi:molybdate-binding protein/DNA-binding XRE family transcriptional regulator